MRKVFLIGLLLLFFANGCKKERVSDGTTSKADSLAYYFEQANRDSLPISERRQYMEKATAIISKNKNDSMSRVNYFKVANRYWNMDALEDYKKIIVLLVENSEEAEDETSLARSYHYLGDYYSNIYKPDSSYYYYFQAENLYKEGGDLVKVASLLSKKSVLQYDYKDYMGCEKSQLKILNILRETDEDFLLFEAYNTLCNIHINLQDYKKALEYQNIALGISRNGKIPLQYQAETKSLSRLATIFSKNNDYKKAMAYYQLALQQPNVFHDNKILYASAINGLANAKFKENDFSSLPDLFYESLDINEHFKNYPDLILTKVNLSNFYAFKNDTILALRFAEDAFKISKENKLPAEILYALKNLIKLNHQKASEYAQEYIRIEDSLQRAERKVRNQFARIEYETEELTTQKEGLIQQQQLILYLVLISILVGTVVFAFRFWLTRKRQKRLIQKQQKSNEEIYRLMMEQHHQVEAGKQIEKKRISRELHHGVMGKLAGIRLNLFILGKKSDAETINRCLEQVDQIQNIEKEIRNIAYSLEKDLYSETFNFVTIVRNLCETMASMEGFIFKHDVDETINWSRLSGSVKINIHRILQQALRNSIQFAEASQIGVSIQQTDETIVVAIVDNGKGFDYKKVNSVPGLLQIKEQMEEIGGQIDVISAKGKGTVIQLNVPFRTK